MTKFDRASYVQWKNAVNEFNRLEQILEDHEKMHGYYDINEMSDDLRAYQQALAEQKADAQWHVVACEKAWQDDVQTILYEHVFPSCTFRLTSLDKIDDRFYAEMRVDVSQVNPSFLSEIEMGPENEGSLSYLLKDFSFWKTQRKFEICIDTALVSKACGSSRGLNLRRVHRYIRKLRKDLRILTALANVQVHQ